MKKAAPANTIKGRVTIDGIRTTFENDGKTVKDQQVILKLNRGILSKRFWLPMSLLDVDKVTQALASKDEEGFPHYMELTFINVTKVPGQRRTYQANLASVVTPLSDQALDALVDSKTIVKEPTSLRVAK